MTGLYLLPITEAEKLPEGFAARYFPKRAERAERYLRHEDLLRSYAAGALCACVLNVEEEAIAFGPKGKPYLKNGGFSFSLSHSGDYALLAADDTDIGADIEKLEPLERRERIAGRVFTEEERLWMTESPETRFYMLWTMKERVMKLDGRGFSLPPESFSALPLLEGGSIETVHGTAYGKTVLLPGCALSVCALHPVNQAPIRILTLKELLAMRKA